MRLALLILVASAGVYFPKPTTAQDSSESPIPSWDDLKARPYPQWFLDAKLGIFIHWGVYSVPSYSGKEDYAEWFVRGLQLGDTLRTRFMQQSFGEDFEYRDFAPLFKAELFDPDEWANVFRRSGARYVVMVSKHHDGYAMWPSRYSPAWNSSEVGPERDLVGELTRSVRAQGLRMGLYYSLAEWNHPLHRWYTDPPESIGPYVDEYMAPQFKELISTFQPSVVFADGEWLNTAEQWRARELIGWYFDRVGPDAVVNDRWGHGSDIGFRTPEYSSGMALSEQPWAEVRGLGRSFGLNRNEKLEAYLSPEELVHFFVRAVAAGGGMILNVGPGADGQIPLLQQERLIQLGMWLDINGEAIFGARPWNRTGESREVSLHRVDPSIDFNWVRNGPGRPIREDDFSATWTGFIRPSYSELYRFEAEADDSAEVWIDERIVEDTISLEADVAYAIRVEYREEKQNASIRLIWSSSSQNREVVPDNRLSAGLEPGSEPGLTVTYSSLEDYLAYTRNGSTLNVITFEWPDEELAIPIPSPRLGMVATLLGLDNPLPWRYANDTLYVDLSAIQFSDIPGSWAWTVRLDGYGQS